MLNFLRKKTKDNSHIELISVHIPKTAGTSFRNTLKSVYGEEAVIRLDIDMIGGRDRLRVNLEDYDDRILPKFARIVHGHFCPADLYDRFTMSRDTPIITWLRNPVDRVISNYYYLAKRLAEELDEKGKGLNILSKMQRTLMEYARDDWNKNRISKFLQGVTLDQLAFVGIQEHYTEDLRALAELLNWKEFPEFRHNTTPNKYEVSPEERAEIAALNELDVALYKEATKLRNKRLGI